jgi:hypothetical protein
LVLSTQTLVIMRLAAFMNVNFRLIIDKGD